MDGPVEPALPLLEKFGLAVLRRTRARAAVSGPDDPIHVLNADELRELRRIERRAVLRAALAGALSGGASAAAAIWAHRFLGPEGSPLEFVHHAKYWGAVLSVTVVASVLEIGFLYWDGLRSVHALASAAGLGLEQQGLSGEKRDVALSLARAALELPNPVQRTYGIDPRRESVRWVVALSALLYKAKVALTTFIVKFLLRSVLGRVMARALFEFAAVPVTAFWNAIVCFIVVREARLRTMGPSAASQLVAEALADNHPSPEGRTVAFRSVASAIVRTQDFHPNHLALVRSLIERLGPIDFDAIDDSARFVRELGALGAADQSFALNLLVIAAVLDGRLTRAEKRLLEEAFRACRRPFELARVERLRRAFRAGKGVDFALVRDVTLGGP